MVQKPEAKRRGRPRAYDAEQALSRALDAFWTAGFEATSLDDLTTATGMNRPSLYAAFGDKRAFFLKALTTYRARNEIELAKLVGQGGSVRDTLVNAYAGALRLYYSGEAGPRGCFLTGAALVSAVEDPGIRDGVRDGLAELDESFVALFERGRQTGEVARAADTRALGLMASALLHTLSVRARAGAPPADLVNAAAKGVDTLLRAARS